LDYPAPAQTFIDEDFEGSWGPRGDNPPTGWAIEDLGDMGDGWNNNDWYNYDLDNALVGEGAGNNVARVQWWNVEQQDERLITPLLNFASYPDDIFLSFWHDYNDMSVNDQGSVDISLNGGSSWPITITQYAADVTEDARFDISSDVAGHSNVMIRWRYTSLNDLWWMLDNVTIEYDPSPNLVEVYNETRATGSMDPLDTQQLTWNYDFPTVAEYMMVINTELAGDEDPLNDRLEITIDVINPPLDDALFKKP